MLSRSCRNPEEIIKIGCRYLYRVYPEMSRSSCRADEGHSVGLPEVYPPLSRPCATVSNLFPPSSFEQQLLSILMSITTRPRALKITRPISSNAPVSLINNYGFSLENSCVRYQTSRSVHEYRQPGKYASETCCTFPPGAQTTAARRKSTLRQLLLSLRLSTQSLRHTLESHNLRPAPTPSTENSKSELSHWPNSEQRFPPGEHIHRLLCHCPFGRFFPKLASAAHHNKFTLRIS
ncbi:hypothetical protein KCU91_g5, partial [Aureobasidium melanogenum]